MIDKKVVVVATGGTIAMKYDPEKDGLVPACTGEDLAAAVPGLGEVAPLEFIQFSNIASPGMTPQNMWDLHLKLEEVLARDDVAGAIVTHGTDTLEETSYFLDLLHTSPKPIVTTAAMRGADVTLIHGETALQPVKFTTDVPVTTAQQMYEAVTSRFDATDVLIMAAAVADYRPVTVASDKIKKKDGDLSIPVERTADILGTIGPKKTHQFLCGFSMETRDMVENSTVKLTRKNLDMVVANNLKVAGAGFGVDTNVVTFITPDGTRELPLMSKADVADAILDEILKRRGL